MALLIGLAGGSCSGKTTLVNSLSLRLGEQVSVLSFDDYFIGLEVLEGIVVEDWESPELYHYDQFVSDLEKLKQGQSVELVTNSRESSVGRVKALTILPKPLVIVEGFLIFHDPRARALFDKKIFLDLPEEEIVRRRLERSSSGSDGWDDPVYIRDKLIPGHRRFVQPQRDYADTILDGTETTEVLVEDFLKGVRG